MRDLGTKWTAVPDWSNAVLEAPGLKVVTRLGLIQHLVSGDLEAFAARAGLSGTGVGAFGRADGDRYMARLARDRVLAVGDLRFDAPPGWCGAGFAVTPYPAVHSAGGNPCFSLRFECDGKVVTYSGDTAWSDALAQAAQGSDLFICECSSYEKPVKGHLAYLPLKQNLPALGAKRVILTHMNPDMLAKLAEVEIETARDGLTLTV